MSARADRLVCIAEQLEELLGPDAATLIRKIAIRFENTPDPEVRGVALEVADLCDRAAVKALTVAIAPEVPRVARLYREAARVLRSQPT